MLEIEALSVSYGKREVLSRVSLSVKEGEVLAVLGHNGAGKTTLLKSVVSLVRAESGGIHLDGTQLCNTSPRMAAEAGVRLLPSEFRGIFSSRTVLDNLKIAMPARMGRDKARQEQEIAYCLEIFPDLRQKLKQPAGSLSGGQQQMVAMAVALMGRPRVLLLDEPSIGLSPNLVQRLLDEVRRLSDSQGLAAILVEQNANVALRIADRVAALRTGTIIREAPAGQVTQEQLWDLF